MAEAKRWQWHVTEDTFALPCSNLAKASRLRRSSSCNDQFFLVSDVWTGSEVHLCDLLTPFAIRTEVKGYYDRLMGKIRAYRRK